MFSPANNQFFWWHSLKVVLIFQLMFVMGKAGHLSITCDVARTADSTHPDPLLKRKRIFDTEASWKMHPSNSVPWRIDLSYTTCLFLCFLFSPWLSTWVRDQGLTINKASFHCKRPNWAASPKHQPKSTVKSTRRQTKLHTLKDWIQGIVAMCGNNWPILTVRDLIG